MIDDTNKKSFIDLHEEGAPFNEIVTTLGITPEEAFIHSFATLTSDFELCEDSERWRPKQAYLDLIAAIAAFVKAGQ